MKDVIVTVVHALPGRLRIHIHPQGLPPSEIESRLLQTQGILTCQYSPHSRNVLIGFNEEILSPMGVFKSLILALADRVGHKPIYLRQSTPFELSPSAWSSALLIGFNSLVHILNPTSRGFGLLKWSMVMATGYTILEHTLGEVKRTGTFDMENLSIVYLFNSLQNRQLIRGSLVSWLATSTLHLLPIGPPEGLVCRVIEGRDSQGLLHLQVLTQGFIDLEFTKTEVNPKPGRVLVHQLQRNVLESNL